MEWAGDYAEYKNILEPARIQKNDKEEQLFVKRNLRETNSAP